MEGRVKGRQKSLKICCSQIIALFLLASVLFVLQIPDPLVASQKQNVLFIHHSVGESLIRDGSVREILNEAGYKFWDHGYNHPEIGLRNEQGKPAGCYWIPEDNTNPDGIASLFQMNPKEENAFSIILRNHDVIVFKSCFPVSQISEDNISRDSQSPGRRSLYNYKRHYLSIRNIIDKHPEKIFIIVTQPPLHPNATNQVEAKRARAFVDWVTSNEFLGERKNIFVFDYFNLLSDPKTNMLKTEYQIDPKGKNSHPNPLAQMMIGPQFADFIINTVKYGRNAHMPKVLFDNPEWPNRLVRLSNPVATMSGTVKSSYGVKKILWTDLKGQRGELLPADLWRINNIVIYPGMTKVIVTAIDHKGMRSSSVIGLQFYSGKAHQEYIFDGSRVKGNLNGISYTDAHHFSGKNRLVIRGTGQPQRVSINGIGIDISDYDPETTYLEIIYDQGTDKSETVLSLIGIGNVSLRADDTAGDEKLIVPLRNFVYVHNMLDKLVLKGTWSKKTLIYIDSIKVVCSGKKI
jgi:hypothetical protein